MASGRTCFACSGRISGSGLALRRPLRTNLSAGYTPHLFRVGLEEQLVESLPETIRNPLFKVLFDRAREHVRLEIARADHGGLDEPQTPQGVHGLQGVVEELAVVVDPRQPPHRDEVVPEDLVPQRLDGRDLREETMLGRG